MAQPSKPNHVKEAQGTLRKCRVNTSPATSEPLSAIPAVPPEVPDDGAGYFTWACEILYSFGELRTSFIPSITRAAQMHSQYERHWAIVNETGALQTTQSGYTQKTGAWTLMTEAYKFLNEFEREYGLTLSSSQKITVQDKQKNNADFD